MGILNVTPDSFSDGGRYASCSQAVEHALEMQRAGAMIIDVGGESTRPGSQSVPFFNELQRVLPVIREIRRCSDVIISVDTRKPEVAHAALEAGADIIND
ncbi:MAG: dihydropteroate synthase, partial [Akkermansia sp.]